MDFPTPSKADEGSAMMKDEEEEEEEEDETFLLLRNANSPMEMRETAGDKACCIFRVSNILGRNNDATYEPKLISIGPYHRNKRHLKMIEEHKQRYLEYFLSKTAENGVTLNKFVDLVSRLEPRIRASYSENLDLNRQELVSMMILDGCFILMMLLVVSRNIKYKNFSDPIFKVRYILPTLRSDFLLLENQVPLFLLKDLLEVSRLVRSTGLNEMAFEFFKYSIKRRNELWEKHKNIRAKHLLDLIRKTFIPSETPQTTERQCCINIFSSPGENSRKNTCLGKICCSKESSGLQPSSLLPSPFRGLIVSAKRLRIRGIKFKPRVNVDTPLDIVFKTGVLEVPPLVFDDFISSFMINCVAFEQLNVSCSTEMTSYVTFMGCLINTEDDATFLVEKGIIENYFGTSEEVSLFFKNTRKDISFNVSRSYLSDVFERVNKHPHSKVPWKLLSSAAASILLLLTILQTFFSAYAYFCPPKTN